MEKNNKNGILLIIILAVVFGMSAGVVGNLVARVFILQENFDIPFYGEIDFSRRGQNGSGIVISGAKKVVVEQNDKIIETANSVRSSLVGIYKKKTNKTSNIEKTENNIFNLEDYYLPSEELGQGLIITSDGWILSSFLPIADEDYVIITHDKKIYDINEIESDTLTSYNFLHIDAKDLPVRKIAGRGEVENGQIVILVKKSGEVFLDSILDKDDDGDKILFYSDSVNKNIKLVNNSKKDFNGSFLFNLSGDVLGSLKRGNEVDSIINLQGAIKSLLRDKEIVRVKLGIYYIDLSKLINIDKLNGTSQYSKGALISKNIDGVAVLKNSVGEKAGLKEGDIILAINGMEINNNNNDLSEIIQSYATEDIVDIKYMRNDEESNIEVILGEK